MDWTFEKEKLFKHLKKEILDLEEKETHLTKGYDEKPFVKEEVFDPSLVKEEVDDEDFWKYESYETGEEPKFEENTEDYGWEETAEGLEGEMPQDEVESFPHVLGHPVPSEACPISDNTVFHNLESYDGSFNAHEVLSNEAIVREEGENVEKKVSKKRKLNEDDKTPAQEELDHGEMCTMDGCIDKPFKCDRCPEAFSLQYHLDVHQRSHTARAPFECDVCGCMASNQRSLKKHKQIHTGETPHGCSVCDAHFARRSELNTHMRIHTGERPYKCMTCMLSFFRWYDLKMHMRIHECRHECKVCGYKALSQGRLKIHQRIHTGEKPFSCPTCDFKTAHSTALKTHKRAFFH